MSLVLASGKPMYSKFISYWIIYRPGNKQDKQTWKLKLKLRNAPSQLSGTGLELEELSFFADYFKLPEKSWGGE